MPPLATPRSKIEEESPSMLSLVLRKMWHLRMGVLGASLIIRLIFVALFCPYLAPHDPYKQDITKRLWKPAFMVGGNAEKPLGADHLAATSSTESWMAPGSAS